MSPIFAIMAPKRRVPRRHQARRPIAARPARRARLLQRRRRLRPPPKVCMRIFKRYFITGLLIWIPLVITLWVIALLINTLESVVPSFLTSQSLFGYPIPGFQLVLVVLIVFLSGLF